MAAAVRGIAATRDQLALFELVEKSDDVAWIQAQRVGERLLARRSACAEQLQGDWGTGPEAAGPERGAEGAGATWGRVVGHRKEGIVQYTRERGFRHTREVGGSATIVE